MCARGRRRRHSPMSERMRRTSSSLMLPLASSAVYTRPRSCPPRACQPREPPRRRRRGGGGRGARLLRAVGEYAGDKGASVHAHVPALNALGRERAEGGEVLREPDCRDDLAEVLRRAHRHDPERRAGRRVRPDGAAHDANLQRRPAHRPRSALSAGGRRARGDDGVTCMGSSMFPRSVRSAAQTFHDASGRYCPSRAA